MKVKIEENGRTVRVVQVYNRRGKSGTLGEFANGDGRGADRAAAYCLSKGHEIVEPK